MRERIIEELREIEEKEQVKIILAVESGSRAWGFESPDSDYDVRFIYVRKEDYLKLERVRDVIEWRLDETLDINGWDLKKTLQLLKNSNPTLFEWCNSPIVYMETKEASLLREILPQYFSVKKSLYHYWHMAEANYRQFLKGEMVKVKKYFYVLRPLMAAKWILEKKMPPPMLFETLIESQLELELKPEVERLLEKKKATPEMGVEPRIQILNDYIEQKIPEVKVLADVVKDEKRSWDELNRLFLQVVRGWIGKSYEIISTQSGFFKEK